VLLGRHDNVGTNFWAAGTPKIWRTTMCKIWWNFGQLKEYDHEYLWSESRHQKIGI